MMGGDAGMPPKPDTVTAIRWTGSMDAGRISAGRGLGDGAGRAIRLGLAGPNADPTRETQVRLTLDSGNAVRRISREIQSHHGLRRCRFARMARQIVGRRCLRIVCAERSVAASQIQEFEVAPNGNWIDLAINLDGGAHGKHDLTSGLKRRVSMDEATKTWRAVLALPMKSLTAKFDPSKVWRVNFFRSKARASRGSMLRGSRRRRRCRVSCAGSFRDSNSSHRS